MATNIPPHNLREIIDATIMLIQNPHSPARRSDSARAGPGFPHRRVYFGPAGNLDAFTKGRGSTEAARAGGHREFAGKDKDAIIVTEIPYQVNKARLIEQAAALVNDKKLEGISEIRDESDRDGMRIVFELKRGEQAEVVLNNLYKHTQMQVNFGVIMLSIVERAAARAGPASTASSASSNTASTWCAAAPITCCARRASASTSCWASRKPSSIWMPSSLSSANRARPKRRASGSWASSPARMSRRRSTRAWCSIGASARPKPSSNCSSSASPAWSNRKLLDELAEIQRQIAEYLEILGSDRALRNVIIKELREVQKEFGDERRTEIVEDAGDISLEDLIQNEEVVVTVTRGGYLKRTALDTYRRQTRGGKGRIGMATRSEDVVEHVMVAMTHSYLLIFTNKGRLYWLKIYNIPDAAAAGKGRNINGLINLQPDETVKAFLAVREFTPDRYVVMATKYGVIKKCELTEFDNPTSRGIIAIGLKDNDELIAAKLSTGKDLIFLATRDGMAIKFPEQDVRPMGRPAAGVTSMKLAEGDSIVGMEIVSEDDLILAVSENGYGKRTKISEYRLQSRAGKGVINMKVTGKTGKVMAVLGVKEDTDVILITKEGKIIRLEASEIRQVGRSTQGVRLVKLDEGDRVAAASVIPAGENGDTPNGSNGQAELPLQ
jgi:DNA gyrase subunit A